MDFTYAVSDGDHISVYPVFERLDISPVTRLRPEPLRIPRFIADVHLKTLARKLRMLGFDTLYNPDWDDPRLAQITEQENRILLARDTGLLKRNIVHRGIAIASGNPAQQLEQVISRMDLYRKIRPFSRCISCNGILEATSVNLLLDADTKVPPAILATHGILSFCTSCGHIYWPGSHYDRMKEKVGRLSGDSPRKAGGNP